MLIKCNSFHGLSSLAKDKATFYTKGLHRLESLYESVSLRKGGQVVKAPKLRSQEKGHGSTFVDGVSAYVHPITQVLFSVSQCFDFSSEHDAELSHCFRRH